MDVTSLMTAPSVPEFRNLFDLSLPKFRVLLSIVVASPVKMLGRSSGADRGETGLMGEMRHDFGEA